MGTLLLSQQEIQDLISMKDVVDVVEKTFRGMGEGTVVNPTKVGLDLGAYLQSIFDACRTA